MDPARALISSVVRMFYDLHHVLVIEALMIHSALSVDDMYHLTSVQSKDLRKHLGRLKEDRLVSVQQRQEIKQNTTRPIHRDYYFINYHFAVDAIKYRIYHLTQTVSEQHQPTLEKKDYFCPRCRSQWTQLEVLDKVGPDGFECHRCGNLLERNEISVADRAGSQRQAKLMQQIDPLLSLLKKIDAEVIPPNDFASAMAVAVPVRRNEAIHPTQVYEVVKTEGKNKGTEIKSEAMADIEVNISSGMDNEEAERVKAQKARQEAQNALPSWHTQSTVGLGAGTGLKAEQGTLDAAANGTSPTVATSSSVTTIKKEDGESKEGIVEAAKEELFGWEEYYANIQQEQERRDQLPPPSESEFEDEDDDGFEEVEIGSTASISGANGINGISGVNTPISSNSASVPPSGTLNGSGSKRKIDDGPHGNGMSGAETGASSLAGTPSRDESPTKKIKLEAGVVKIERDTVIAPLSTVKQEDVDSDEDEEFEDAL